MGKPFLLFKMKLLYKNGFRLTEKAVSSSVNDVIL